MNCFCSILLQAAHLRMRTGKTKHATLARQTQCTLCLLIRTPFAWCNHGSNVIDPCVAYWRYLQTQREPSLCPTAKSRRLRMRQQCTRNIGPECSTSPAPGFGIHQDITFYNAAKAVSCYLAPRYRWQRCATGPLAVEAYKRNCFKSLSGGKNLN